MAVLGNIIRLALRDYWHERLLSACSVLSLAAVLAPLLVLFGIKFGIINTLTERLLKDPRNLEVSPIGSGRFPAPWFEQAAAHPSVAFVVPQTRTIAATMDLKTLNGPHSPWVTVDLIPTADGDPLVGRWSGIPQEAGAIVLSEPAARRLGVRQGDEVRGRVGRVVSGQRQEAGLALRVLGVLPLSATGRAVGFVTREVLEATEDYRDGLGVTALGWPGRERPDAAREYPQFRMFARALGEVSILRKWLNEQGLEVYTRAEEIETVQTLDRAFSLIFRLIALVAILGYFASTASSTLANVKRKSRHLGVTRLIGFCTSHIVWFPVVQALATSLLGVVSAYALYWGVELTINHMFNSYVRAEEVVCRLLPRHLAMAAALTCGVSILAASYTAFRAARIEPSEVIRDV